MATYIGSSSALLRRILLVTAALVLLADGAASAPVGVTSGADGDPLGKPPNENERILRIGIDVQANELVTTSANDRAHLVFLDGSSLTVGPNARLTIDKFVYDPNSQKGELAVNASKGVFRLVGGKISKSNPITITTPSATIGIRGGITIVTATEQQTIADFIFGTKMTVFAAGVTEVLTRAGSQSTINRGAPPGPPTLLKPGSLNAALNQLEGGKSNNNKNPDQTAQSSGFSKGNSGQPPNVPNVNQNLPPNTNNNILTTAISDSGPANNPAAKGNTTPVATPSTPPPPPPPPQSQTFTGFASGLVVKTHNNSVQVSPLAGGEVSVTTDPANSQVKGTIVVPLNTSTTAVLELGGVNGKGASNSTFINNQTYAMVTQTNDPSRPSTFHQGEAIYPLPNATALATNSVASALNIPFHGQLGACTCEYLTWGWWATAFSDPQPDVHKAYAVIGNFVGGTPTTSVQLPQTGSATYKGFMAGTVQNGNNVYGAGGSYQADWSFAQRRGSFNGSFDGRGYSGSIAASSSGASFSGNFSGGDRSGNLNGAFFSSPTDAAKYQAGTFSIGGSSYNASGVFAGQR